MTVQKLIAMDQIHQERMEVISIDIFIVSMWSICDKHCDRYFQFLDTSMDVVICESHQSLRNPGCTMEEETLKPFMYYYIHCKHVKKLSFTLLMTVCLIRKDELADMYSYLLICFQTIHL